MTQPTNAEIAALLLELLDEVNYAVMNCGLPLDDELLPDRARAMVDQLTQKKS